MGKLKIIEEDELDDPFDKSSDKGKGLIFGNYKVIKEIRRGTFGVTYEAEHTFLKGKKACIKKSIEVDQKYQKHIMREASIMWDLQHYSLPTLKDFYMANDNTYVMVMSFAKGKSLDDIIDRLGGKVEPVHVSWMTQRLYNVLHYTHHYGIIHGDVKPENLIIDTPRHNVTLVDFDIATLMPKESTKAIGYTSNFAAPEILAGKSPLPQSDLYSAAASMVYALGGDHTTRIYPSSVPADLQNYYNRFLESDPLKRPDPEKEDIIRQLSDIRLKVFGDRRSNSTLIIH